MGCAAWPRTGAPEAAGTATSGGNAAATATEPPPTEPPPTEPPPSVLRGAVRPLRPAHVGDRRVHRRAARRDPGQRARHRRGRAQGRHEDRPAPRRKRGDERRRHIQPHQVEGGARSVRRCRSLLVHGDGTIAGHLLVRNPQVAAAWGGRQISHATLEEMARYSRQRWPAIPTIVHAPPSWLADKSTAWQYLDAASAMYSGSAGDAGAWVAQQASEAAGGAAWAAGRHERAERRHEREPAARERLHGNFAMSASQLRTWGSALVAPSRVCGVLMARYDAGYFGRSDIRDAVATVSSKARARAATSCRMRT